MKKNNLIFSISVLFLLINPPVSAQADIIGSDIKLPGHPRILMLKGEEEAVKKTITTDETWGKLQGAILTECDNLITTVPVERIQIGRRLLDKSREPFAACFFFPMLIV